MINKQAEVTASPALHSLKLNGLVGKKGTIVAMGVHDKGAFIQFNESFLNETEWFIPMESIKLL